MSRSSNSVQERAHELLKTIIEVNPGVVVEQSVNPGDQDEALQITIGRINTLYDAIIETYRKHD